MAMDLQDSRFFLQWVVCWYSIIHLQTSAARGQIKREQIYLHNIVFIRNIYVHAFFVVHIKYYPKRCAKTCDNK